ncbi:hypothetical protein GF362_02105 [Candidatus Dojkabacteria bacterium]|nr:hypothetical protein [Candidatus Dojkabacteria bacterium]
MMNSFNKYNRKRMGSSVLIVFLLIALLIIILLISQSIRNQSTAPELSEASDSFAKEEITLMSFNVLYKKLEQRMNEITDYIASKQPDFICMQEIYTNNNYKTLKKQLKEKGWEMNSKQELDYMAIFSRYPIEDYQTYSDAQDRRIMTFQVTLPSGHIVRLFNIHPNTKNPCKSNLELLKIQKNYENNNKFLLGDFNMSEKASCYTNFLTNFYEACNPVLADQCTDSVNDEVWHKLSGGKGENSTTIDHIFVSKNSEWKVVEAYIDHNMKSSDHFPVIAKMEYTGTTTDPTVTQPNTPTLTQTEVISATIIPSPSNLQPSCGPIDTNSNFQVDITDFSSFKELYGKSCSNTTAIGDCGSKDTDENEIIDINDFKNFIDKYKNGC